MWKNLIYQGKEYINLLVSDSGEIKNKIKNFAYKLNKIGTGYLAVCISLGSRDNRKLFKVHKAVAETFISNPNNYKCINHIDGNKLNNRVDNLEWCTQGYNVKHSYDNKLKDVLKVSGENNYNSKLTNNDVKYIRENYKPFDKKFGSRALGRKFNVNKQTIIDIANFRMWKHI